MKTTCPLCSSHTIGDVGTRGAFTLAFCKECSFPFLKQDFEYDAFYTDFYYQNYHNPIALLDESKKADGEFSYGESEAAHAGAYTRALDTLSRFTTLTGKRFLDVGCAEGVGLSVAQSRGLNVAGIDVSPQAIAVCQEKGFLSTSVDTLHSIEAVSKFDVATLLDVLEHMQDPVGDIRALREHITSGGFVFVENNFFSLRAFQHDPDYFNTKFEPPFHCSYFSEKQAIRLFSACGFQLVYRRPQWVRALFVMYRSLKSLLNREFRMARARAQKERVANPQSLSERKGPRLGRFLNRRYPTGLVFKRV